MALGRPRGQPPLRRRRCQLRLLVACELLQLARAASKDPVLAHIQCQVCELAVREAAAIIQEEAVGPDEEALTDLVEGICSMKRREGRWVQRMDISRGGGGDDFGSGPISWIRRLLFSWLGWGTAPSVPVAVTSSGPDDAEIPLALVRRDQVGVCRKECMLVHRACKQVLKGKEDRLVAMLAKATEVETMRAKICKKPCEQSTLPKLGDWKDEVFQPRDSQELETEDLISKMKLETGQSMKVYKREEMLAMSEGDIEAMAAREAFGAERAAAQRMQEDL